MRYPSVTPYVCNLQSLTPYVCYPSSIIFLFAILQCFRQNGTLLSHLTFAKYSLQSTPYVCYPSVKPHVQSNRQTLRSPGHYKLRKWSQRKEPMSIHIMMARRAAHACNEIRPLAFFMEGRSWHSPRHDTYQFPFLCYIDRAVKDSMAHHLKNIPYHIRLDSSNKEQLHSYRAQLHPSAEGFSQTRWQLIFWASSTQKKR